MATEGMRPLDLAILIDPNLFVGGSVGFHLWHTTPKSNRRETTLKKGLVPPLAKEAIILGQMDLPFSKRFNFESCTPAPTYHNRKLFISGRHEQSRTVDLLPVKQAL